MTHTRRFIRIRFCTCRPFPQLQDCGACFRGKVFAEFRPPKPERKNPYQPSDLCRICGDPLPPRGQGVELREICLPCRKTWDQAWEAELVFLEGLSDALYSPNPKT